MSFIVMCFIVAFSAMSVAQTAMCPPAASLDPRKAAGYSVEYAISGQSTNTPRTVVTVALDDAANGPRKDYVFDGMHTGLRYDMANHIHVVINGTSIADGSTVDEPTDASSPSQSMVMPLLDGGRPVYCLVSVKPIQNSY